MPLKIIRNDITKMSTDAVVNTANAYAAVGSGCDHEIYQAAGYDELLKYRKEKIGYVPEGEVFVTPGFRLNCRYIIHAVSPLYKGGKRGEEGRLRSCYKKSLQAALSYELKSVAFPLIATGGFGYPKEEGLRIAVDEINAFLMKHDMLVFLVVFDSRAAELGRRLDPDLEYYIDRNYVETRLKESSAFYNAAAPSGRPVPRQPYAGREYAVGSSAAVNIGQERDFASVDEEQESVSAAFSEKHESALDERIKHLSDTFSEYLLYLIDSRGMNYPDVYKRAIVDKKVFSKIKKNRNAHPKKTTAMCLCVGAKLNMDQTRDLLARAGYALSPCDKTDIIFSYFIENGIYDMIELDIQLEEHGLPCFIT